MKKIMYIVIFLFIFAVGPVNASSFSTSVTSISNIKTNEQFTVTFNVVNGTNIMGIDAKLNYDSSKLTVVSTSGLNSYTALLGTRLVAYKTTGSNGTFGFAKVTFKTTSSFKESQKTTISLSDVKGSNGSDITGNGSSKSIYMPSTNNNLSTLEIDNSTISGFSSTKTSYSMTVNNNVSSIIISATAQNSKSSISGAGQKTLKDYTNVYNIVVTAENGSKKTYKITINRKDKDGLLAPLSSDSTLKTLEIDGYNINYNKDKIQYELEVENNIKNLVIKATSNNSKAKVTISNNNELKIGINTIKITVTAENGSKTEYLINVTRSNEGPTTTTDNFASVAKETISEIINIEIKDDKTILETKFLEQLQESKKTIVINRFDNNRLIYSWKINGNNLTEKNPINININSTSANEDKLNLLTNYSKYITLNFDHSGDLPKETIVTFYVGDNYKDGDQIKLYYYNATTNTIELIEDKLIVENGYVEFEIEHCSEYLLSMSDIIKDTTNKNTSPLIYILGILAFLEALYIGYLLSMKEKK